MENKSERSVPINIEEEKIAIEFILKESEECKNKVIRRIISSVTPRQIEDLRNMGILINENWVHSIETSAVIHVTKRHGTKVRNPRKGQIPITNDDFRRIPSILKEYDNITLSDTETKSTGNSVIRYEKKFEDGTIFYLEEKRDGRRSLALQTMYKKI